MDTIINLKKDMHFEADLEGFKIQMDADEEFGGKNKGPKPKGLVLVALAGCSGMDIISILKKMRAEPDTFNIKVSGELNDGHPKIYKNILITYIFKGDKVTEEKAKKAIDLSLDKYCSVSAMIKGTVNIDYKIIIEK